MNAAQQTAVDSDHPLIVTVATAGSGKTETLCNRIVRLSERHSTGEMVAITFTNAAADELRARMAKKGVTSALKYAGTLHGFMLRLLQADWWRIGGPKKIVVVDKQQEMAILEKALEELNYKGSQKGVEDLAKVYYQRTAEYDRSTMNKEQLVVLRWSYLMEENGMLTFDSILFYGLRLLRAMQKDESLRARNFIQFLFVDEYQDSGTLDGLIYKLLPVKNRFFVGDPDQAIYGFRGGTPANLLEVANAETSQLVMLEDCYRCDNAITVAAQNLINHAKARVPKETRSQTGQSGLVTMIVCPAEAQEEAFLAMQCQYALKEGRSVAVLCRTNNMVGYYDTALRKWGVPIQKVQQAQMPKDYAEAIKLMQLLANPANDMLAYQFLAGTRGKAYADSMKQKAALEMKSINAVTLNLPRSVRGAEVPDMLRNCGIGIEAIGVVRMALDRVGNDASIGDLVNYLFMAKGEEVVVGEGVTVCTVHKAKGREWDAVIIPAMEDGNYPHKQAEDLEEERRMMFVAITRARHNLFFTTVEARMCPYKGVPITKQPSVFIDELKRGQPFGWQERKIVAPTPEQW